ncbi:MAG TPA: DUF6454 family protein [Candidatus Hydrogenedentes bacterium]|nr:DUF6454 family protein [Candidatus Hydrogenedentota bacterium]HOC73216.1 DUF6454 family protein [Candidatus Hydrogenedentota bacterium]HOH50008.1 DUF6454 family protein [Candidatus Hydrogenedentota bacterium]HQL93821.1 DUF6454 family protein [Candidatus Hydrogenedentota bacterium]
MHVWVAPLLLTAHLSAGQDLAAAFQALGKDAVWTEVSSRALEFPSFHPQGMAAVGDRLFLSSVEVLDREAGKGTGHLFEMDREGRKLREITLGEGALYHPGGMDHDGGRLWVSVGEYRPDSRSIVYTVDPATLESREVFRFADHLGAVAHLPEEGLLVGVSWGARRWYSWKTETRDGVVTVPDPDHPESRPNGNHYIDYQDMQRVPGTRWLLCAGLQQYTLPGGRLPALRLGGIDLVDTAGPVAVHQIPVPVRNAGAPAWTQNPFLVEMGPDGVRFLFVSGDDHSTLHVFETKPRP